MAEAERRTLIAVDPDALSTAVATYLARVLPSTGPLALDGKTRRHFTSGVSFDGPQQLMLLRGEADLGRCLLAEPQKSAQLAAKGGQHFVLAFRDGWGGSASAIALSPHGCLYRVSM